MVSCLYSELSPGHKDGRFSQALMGRGLEVKVLVVANLTFSLGVSVCVQDILLSGHQHSFVRITFYQLFEGGRVTIDYIRNVC